MSLLPVWHRRLSHCGQNQELHPFLLCWQQPLLVLQGKWAMKILFGGGIPEERGRPRFLLTVVLAYQFFSKLYAEIEVSNNLVCCWAVSIDYKRVQDRYFE